MGWIFRIVVTVVALAVFAPLAAMFSEPFFSELLRLLNVDTSKWAGPAVTFVADLASQEWFRIVAGALIGVAAGAWGHWVATRIDARSATTKAIQARADLTRQERLAAKEKRVATQKPLTAHAVERKLRVLDAALDLLKEVQPMLDRGPVLMRDRWHESGENGVVTHADAVQGLISSIRDFSKRVDDLRDQNQEYQDVMSALQQTYFNRSVEQLAEYMNACRDVQLAISQGASKNSLNFALSPHISAFEGALKGMEAWRNKARGDLADLRKAISPA